MARRVITFLEDRRVLFGPRVVEDEMECVTSALAIRTFATEQISLAKAGGQVEQLLRSIRAACRRFVDRAGPDARNFRHADGDLGGVHAIDQMSLALGDLRTIIGFAVAALADGFDLQVEDDLAQILPPADEDDPNWLPGFDE
ncbi:hypothetical protein AB0K00_22700 [Dactylosporangium sp. NPDC049525]|uniref:hypothetical protein n=1 Tax=Dactylosporangium sp. NPDC049525 TaxID=3154730 RepID=UPI003422CB2F